MTQRARISLASLVCLVLLLALWFLIDSTGSPIAENDRIVELPEAFEPEELQAPVDTSPLMVAIPKGGKESASPAKPKASVEEELELLELGPDVHGRFGYELEVEVIGRLGRPLAGAQVALAPERHPANLFGETSADGVLRVRWQAHVGLMNIAVAAAGPGLTWSGLRMLEVVSGESRRVQLVLPGEEFLVKPDDPYARYQARENPADRFQAIPATFLSLPKASVSDGVTRFAWMSESSLMEDLRQYGSFRAEFRSKLWSAALDARRSKSFHDSLASGTHEPGHLARGSVRDALGEPAAGALVTIGEDEGVPTRGAYCDEEGKFEFSGVQPGTWYVWVGGDNRGVARSTRQVQLGDASWGAFTLERGFELAGEVISMGSLPLAGWLVELEGTDRTEPYSAVTRTEADGRFSFANVPEMSFSLHARPYSSERTLPVETIRVSANETFVSVRCDSDDSRGFAIQVKDSSERGDEAAELRVFAEPSGRGMWCEHHSEGAYAFPGITAGRYRYSAVSERRGASGESRVHVELGKPVGSGRLSLSGGGEVFVQGSVRASQERTYTLWMKGLEVDSLVAVQEGSPPRHLDLSVGKYELEVSQAGGLVAVLPFTILANETIQVSLPEASN